MKWEMTEPVRGSMIRVHLGSIYHFGIYVSDDEVIQFGLAPQSRAMLRDSEVEVLASDIDTFLAGGFLEVAVFDKKEKKKQRSPEEVISYARSKIGERGYSILYNNCEHFANECLTGEHISRQADDVRAMFRSMPICDVYIAPLPECEMKEPLVPAIRQEDVDRVANPRNRSISLLLYKFNIEGFLHWGFNFYNNCGSGAHINPFLDTSSGGGFPSGDAFSVYPGAGGEPLESMRLVTFKQGLDDLAAFRLCESLYSREEVISALESFLGEEIKTTTYINDSERMTALRNMINEMIKAKL